MTQQCVIRLQKIKDNATLYEIFAQVFLINRKECFLWSYDRKQLHFDYVIQFALILSFSLSFSPSSLIFLPRFSLSLVVLAHAPELLSVVRYASASLACRLILSLVLRVSLSIRLSVASTPNNASCPCHASLIRERTLRTYVTDAYTSRERSRSRAYRQLYTDHKKYSCSDLVLKQV